MTGLGFRCSNQDYTYAVLAGSREQPELVETDSIPFPRGFSRRQSLRWFLHEIEDLLDRFPVDIVVVKESEGQKRDKSFVARIEHEAMIYLATVNCGITGVFKKRKCTIAKDLGLKGLARDLSRLDTSAIPHFDSLPAKAQEAAEHEVTSAAATKQGTMVPVIACFLYCRRRRVRDCSREQGGWQQWPWLRQA